MRQGLPHCRRRLLTQKEPCLRCQQPSEGASFLGVFIFRGSFIFGKSFVTCPQKSYCVHLPENLPCYHVSPGIFTTWRAVGVRSFAFPRALYLQRVRALCVCCGLLELTSCHSFSPSDLYQQLVYPRFCRMGDKFVAKCLCGDCEVEAEGPPVVTVNCHCSCVLVTNTGATANLSSPFAVSAAARCRPTTPPSLSSSQKTSRYGNGTSSYGGAQTQSATGDQGRGQPGLICDRQGGALLVQTRE